MRAAAHKRVPPQTRSLRKTCHGEGWRRTRDFHWISGVCRVPEKWISLFFPYPTWQLQGDRAYRSLANWTCYRTI